MLAELVAAGGDGDPAAIAAAKGFEAMDTGALEAAVDAAIAAQPGAWAKYCAGEDKVAGALVGAVMKATKGQADGKAVTALLQARRAGAAAGLNPAPAASRSGGQTRGPCPSRSERPRSPTSPRCSRRTGAASASSYEAGRARPPAAGHGPVAVPHRASTAGPSSASPAPSRST